MFLMILAGPISVIPVLSFVFACLPVIPDHRDLESFSLPFEKVSKNCCHPLGCFFRLQTSIPGKPSSTLLMVSFIKFISSSGVNTPLTIRMEPSLTLLRMKLILFFPTLLSRVTDEIKSIFSLILDFLGFFLILPRKDEEYGLPLYTMVLDGLNQVGQGAGEDHLIRPAHPISQYNERIFFITC